VQVSGSSIIADLLMKEAVVERRLDYGEDESAIEIESSSIPIFHELRSAIAPQGVDRRFIINLFESSYHCDSEPIRMSDGAVVVVDLAGTISARTKNILREALRQGLMPVLVIDNCHKYFDVTKVAVVYEVLSAFLSELNDSMIDMPGYHFSPEKGTVAFSAGLQGWAFTLANFAEQLAVGKTGHTG
jgi:elongation factor 2